MTIKDTLNEIKQYPLEEYFEQFGKIERMLMEVEQNISDWKKEEQHSLLKEMLDAQYPIWMKIHILSFGMKVLAEASYAEQLLDLILGASNDEIGEYNKLSHYWQICTAVFVKKELDTAEVRVKLARLYKVLFQAFAVALDIRWRRYVPIEERDENQVFIFASQVLGLEHAPTKTLLDRCYTLQKYLGKKVLIVNTAMHLTTKGAAPFYHIVEAGYNPELSEKAYLEFKGERFEFIQCADVMPDLDIIGRIVRLVEQRKPCYLLDIGGNDICADLCGQLVPQVTVSTVFSKLATSVGEYQIVGKQLTEEDARLLEVLEVKREHVKRAEFTFSFKEQQNNYTRKQLKLGETKFILLVVGWRLDDEIEETFMKMLEGVLQQDKQIQIAFMGKFGHYSMWMQRHAGLCDNCVNLGQQEDALAVTECCDLYINPVRNGGGSSAAEALYKGLPVVSLSVGDVAAAAGESFCVSDLDMMQKQILQYKNDRVFYEKMSQKARARAKILMDSNKSFGEIVREIENEIENMAS